MILRNSLLLQLLLLYCLCSHAVSRLYVGERDAGEEYVKILVGFHDRKEEELYVRKQKRQPRTASGKPKTKIVYEFNYTEAVAMEVTRSELAQMQKEMKVANTFSYIEEDFEVPVAQRDDDDRDDDDRDDDDRDDDDRDDEEQTSYGIEMTQAHRTFTADPTWDQQCGVYLCVVDSGVYLDNLDVPYSRGDGYVDGASFGPAAGQDWFNPIGTSHGTQVGGIMIASGGNRRGIVGVIPQGPEDSNICLRVAKVVPNNSGSTSVSTLLQASEWCAEQAGGKPLVINLSFAVDRQTTAERAIYERLYNNGALIVAAAGNFGNSGTTYPGAHDSVISVGSVDDDFERSDFSVFNDDVELVAPGERIFVLQAEGNLVQMTGGTSLATPFVAGLAARIWTGVPRCSNQQIRQALRETADQLGDGVRNREYGFGLIQARDARDWLVNLDCNVGPTPTPPPTGPPTPPPTGAPTPPPTPTPPTPVPPTPVPPTPVPPTPTPPPTRQPTPPPTPTPPTPTPPTGDEVLERNYIRFQNVLQARGQGFSDYPDEIRFTAEEWLIRDPQFDSYSDDRLIQRWVLAILAYGFQRVSNPAAMQSWAQYTGECSWFHTVGEDGGNTLCDSNALYVRLDLRQQNLVGTLPSEVALLSNHLRMIHLYDNLIYGTIPSQLGLLGNLERLELTQNSFNGELPPQLGNLAKLTFLGLGRNQLSGGLRTELGLLSKMNTMGLEFNRFSGPIPNEMGNMGDLTILNMDRNQLAGTIPQSFAQFSNLKFMNLVFNDGLRGMIPDALCQFDIVNVGVDCQFVECSCCNC